MPKCKVDTNSRRDRNPTLKALFRKALSIFPAWHSSITRWPVMVKMQHHILVRLRKVIGFYHRPVRKAKFTIPASTGPNFDQVLRVVDSLQVMAEYKVATPAN